jgi:hypothetical protein
MAQRSVDLISAIAPTSASVPPLLTATPRRDEPHPSRKGRVEVKRGAQAVDLVETDAVGVTTNRPDQDDVSHEGASGVGLHRDVDGPHPPPVDGQRTERTNASARVPGWSVDDLGGVSKGSRRGVNDEVLIVRLARANHPSPPGVPAGLSVCRTWADDVELTPPNRPGRG